MLTEVPARRSPERRLNESGSVTDEAASIRHESSDLASGVGNAGRDEAHDQVCDQGSGWSCDGDCLPRAKEETSALPSSPLSVGLGAKGSDGRTHNHAGNGNHVDVPGLQVPLERGVLQRSPDLHVARCAGVHLLLVRTHNGEGQ